MSEAVQYKELTKRFRGVVAVDGLNLTVPEGAVYALVGVNGAGKTTAIKTLMNILRPSSGSAEVLGTDSRRISPRELQQIGYVSENQEMPEWMTVKYFLKYLKPFYPQWDDALAEELVREFDLPVDRRLRNLSRGMKMKAALASSLAYRPKLIVLDEPFSGLDPLVRDEFIKSLLERATGATVLISSHDLAEIESFASHIGYLDRGRLEFSEELSGLAARFREIEVIMDAPPVLPAAWPPGWIRPESSAAVVRFIDSRFDRERSLEEVRKLFPGARNVSVTAMPLREIFIAVAKTRRAAAW
jgi:ABC-2 type transport system ATP-binding protein